MAKPPRSPLLGYNHNVKYGGQIFHVQTEDSGPGNPHIFTHLFVEGSILASKRADYDPAASDDDVRAMMQAQHKAILKELKQSSYDGRITAFFEARGVLFQAQGGLPGDLPAGAASPDPAPAVASPMPASEQVPSTPAPDDADITEEVPAAALTGLPLPEIVAPPAAAAAVLDLDALSSPADERGPTPEPLPMHLAHPAVPGPGTYTFRRPGRDELHAQSTPPQSANPASTPPVSQRPIVPVVVQRQVVVGAGALPATITRKVPTTPVRRRPVSGGPYVVKEGSHASIPGTVRRVEQAPRPLTAPSEPAPRTAESPRPPQPRPPQEGGPSAFVTDQSLDDVILAYLSQGDGKR